MALPTPEPGLVICYAYLWADQRQAGGEEGLKDRPCAIVIAVKDEDGDTLVYVAPITHSPPSKASAIEIPAAVKRRLGLDAARSWIITDELNRFIWPGRDRTLQDTHINEAGDDDEFNSMALRSNPIDPRLRAPTGLG